MYKEIYLSKEYIAQYVYSSKKNTLFIKYSVLMKIVKLQNLCLDCIWSTVNVQSGTYINLYIFQL